MRVPGEWADRAACAGLDLFYPQPAPGVEPADDPAYQQDVRAARAVCAGCPVAPDCLRWALTAREEWGIWGGATARERKAVLKALRDRGSPSRSDAGLAA